MGEGKSWFTFTLKPLFIKQLYPLGEAVKAKNEKRRTRVYARALAPISEETGKQMGALYAFRKRNPQCLQMGIADLIKKR